MEKGENAGYQHFLLFPQEGFQEPFTQGCQKPSLCDKGFEIIVGKKNKCFGAPFSDVLTMFSTFSKKAFQFIQHLNCQILCKCLQFNSLPHNPNF